MKIEPVTQKMIDGLIKAVGPMAALISGLNEVDISLGRGVLEKGHCLWTTEGHRVTVIASSDGGICVSKSN